jgi:hypothetical protein
MVKLTQLLSFQPQLAAPRRAELIGQMAALLQAPGVLGGLAEPTLPGTLNGGDAIWHLQFADEAAYRCLLAGTGWQALQQQLDAGTVANIERVLYAGRAQGVRAPGLAAGVYRTLLVSALRPGARARWEQFARETLAMPQYIAAIRNWQLSPVLEHSGSRAWTHVWEQEYADLGALQGAYMLHPYHWAHVDRWFDWESPDWIIDRHMCHSFCPLARSVLAPEAA